MSNPPDYKSTLNLPRTAFPMKAELPKLEPQILARWQQLRLYETIQQARRGQPKFILHDGPPYANGDIHIGHALNKILKDFIVRYQTMRGHDSPYVPGWDCHGMPIEHQLFKELKQTKHQVDQVSFRAKARAYAQRYVEIQREQFKRLGVLGDWDHPYLTMASDYEQTILRIFVELVKRGAIYRGKKPVYWCTTCETALAEAEVEYEDRQDESIYVLFQAASAGDTYALVWTTTPWTLPGNVALLVHPELLYAFVKERRSGRTFILLESRIDAVLKETFGWRTEDFEVLQVIPGAQISIPSFTHPFLPRASRLIKSPDVSAEEGTGIVHIAPGHGDIDYQLGVQHHLDILSPVDEQGRFTKDVGAESLVGLPVAEARPGSESGGEAGEGNRQVIKLLGRHLIKETPVAHSYPHCWRCKQPVIFRATPQWFLRVDEGLRRRLLEAAGRVRWIPEVGHSRMAGMLERRPDWCLSRQRYWGTPIPVLHCETCDTPLLEAAILEQLVQRLAKDGTEVWFTDSAEELLPSGCPHGRGHRLRKERDILDVWFDSGVSHEAVLKTRPELAWPASLYLEGSDQHRGWFQVSLIPSVALYDRPPYEQVLTHGFVVDGEGRKMSKSLGNVIAPQEIIDRYGADILRLWVASSDYGEDVRISEAILERVAEAYRKIRNTLRYLLANLADYTPGPTGSLPTAPHIDRWALQRTQQVIQTVTEAYDRSEFHVVFRTIYQYCVLDLSAFYLDALKDRLYTEAKDSPKRRWAQSTLYGILNTLVRLIAPLMSLTADEVWQLMRQAQWVTEPSVHAAAWPTRLVESIDAELDRRWATFLEIRTIVMKALEEQRAQQRIGSPLEAQVILDIRSQELVDLCEGAREELAEAFVVSDVRVQRAAHQAVGSVSDHVRVRVERAPGSKCQRCWKHLPSVGGDARHPALCERCVAVVEHGQHVGA